MITSIVLAPLKFYSPEDERLFFEWLSLISCITKIEGKGRELHLTLADRVLTFNEYRNLRGIFKRYRFKNSEQIEQLSQMIEGSQDDK